MISLFIRVMLSNQICLCCVFITSPVGLAVSPRSPYGGVFGYFVNIGSLDYTTFSVSEKASTVDFG